MIRLHLLGFTPDLKGLVFSGRRGGKSGTYWVPVDDAIARALTQLEAARADREAGGKKGRSRKRPVPEDMEHLTLAQALEITAGRAAITDTLELRAAPEPARVASKLSPRDIQQLLREGRSVEDVANRAGVGTAWVEKFNGPILEERAGVIRATQEAFQERARLGRSGLPIGAAVERNLADRRATAATMSELSSGWDARLVRAHTWRVRLRFQHRGKRRTAEWELRKSTGTVRPKNAVAVDFGWWPADPAQDPKLLQRSSDPQSDGEAGGPQGDGPSGNDGSRRSSRNAARKTTARRSQAKKSGRKKSAAKKKTTAKKTAKKPASKRKPAARKKAAPSKKAAARKKAAPRKKAATRKKATSKKATPKKRSAGSKRGSSRTSRGR